MKKVISTLLFAAVAISSVSCDEIVDLVDNIINPGDKITYTGTTVVSAHTVPIYTNDDSTFILAQGEDEVSIKMSQIKFNENMPALDITISDIPTSNDDDDNDYDFEISSVVPTLEGVPMEKYTITNVSGSYDENDLTIDFVCMTLDVNFTGSVEE